MDLGGLLGKSVPVDEHLRANPNDLVALMRAGRLSAERVAMAAYLGDERALPTGVKPWVPPGDRGVGSTTQRLLGAGLTHRERVWLACLCAERLGKRQGGAPESIEAIRAMQLVSTRWVGHWTLSLGRQNAQRQPRPQCSRRGRSSLT